MTQLRKTIITLLGLGLMFGCEPSEFNMVEFNGFNGEDLSLQGKGKPINVIDDIIPANFVSTVDNPYFPLTPGAEYIYHAETEDGLEVITSTVTSDTKVIMGVTTTVVHVTEVLDGELIEETLDWYAQDIYGNVWYFGEFAQEFEDGEVSTEGSWEAGVDDALPGIIMLGNPENGMSYAQERAPDVAQDMGRVLNLSTTVTVPYGTFSDCLRTEDFNLLEPGSNEFKYYAPGLGLVLEAEPSDGQKRVELVSVSGI